MQGLPVVIDQGLLLPPCPALDLALNLKRLKPGLEVFGPHQFYRPTPLGIAFNLTMLMLGDAMLQIFGVPDIKTVV